ncbi:type II toxin-antitoxin system PemK/MazF family toxin [Tychonema sp. LEGE 07203]|uniref:type II toxin-antitoxin system PemK/MazF family toxin n=1 Tax=Tychonema sp. LEGE 07203 TaxID=1828671 RepID=UPI001882592D|nr:type II toxin-antitoxin system PemK/MazF family toxin [Tychonema sp. LEGE 07203]MBE9095837.1 type II toxin-antitoxin system PemK/MazF family toxin [Tychonema sp. LEGE 07203]
MSYNRGDVVLVLFPNADLRTAKRRPVLIVQANNLGTGLRQTITAMITSNLARAGLLADLKSVNIEIIHIFLICIGVNLRQSIVICGEKISGFNRR